MDRILSVIVISTISLMPIRLWATDMNEELLDAARRGDLKAVQQLTADGANVNFLSSYNITPLWQACSKGRNEVIRFLLKKGANPNIRDEVWKATPLMIVDDVEIVGLLLKNGAKGAESKLRGAALDGSKELVKTILRAKQLDRQVLIGAKAQALLKSHKEIASFLDQVAGAELPAPPTISDEVLQSYSGVYVSERLEEVEVKTNGGQLLFLTSTGSKARLIPAGERTFYAGSATFEFNVREGKPVSLNRSSPFSERSYSRKIEAAPQVAPTGDGQDWIRDNKIASVDTWASFRGPGARGIAVRQNLPQQWDAVAKKGLRWKTPIPGLANSCPIVWKDKVFVTTAVSSAGNNSVRIGLYGAGEAAGDKSKHSWRLYCLDHASGQVLWQRVAHEGAPPVKRHLKSSQANSTPATDGKHVVALFNSGHFCCYDMQGKLLWKKNLGVLNSGAFNDADYQWGFGSSPIIYNGSVIVQCDLQTDSFVAAFDLKNGKQLWRSARDELPSWGTPTVHETSRLPLLITNATNYVRGYDARTGRELWRLARNAAITVPTPIVGHELIFVTSGYRPIQPIYAIRLNAAGDISLQDEQESNEHIAWSKSRNGPYLPTPIVYGDYFYTCANNGVFSCYEAATGKQVYRKRCGSGSATSFTASPVAADGRIYLTAESGVVFAIQAGPRYKLLETHPIGEYCLSTPAISGGLFLIRTQKHLVAIGQE